MSGVKFGDENYMGFLQGELPFQRIPHTGVVSAAVAEGTNDSIFSNDNSS